MSDDSSVTMAAGDRDEFLGDGGTGVLSLSTDSGEPPHAVPVSYGYDAVETAFYFRLAAGEGRSKGELDGRAVTFVTYGRDDNDDGDWRSVVASGHLADVEREDVETESLTGLDRVDIPLVDVFGSPVGDVSFRFLRLDPTELTAREEAPAQP